MGTSRSASLLTSTPAPTLTADRALGAKVEPERERRVARVRGEHAEARERRLKGGVGGHGERGRGPHLTLACVLEQDSNRALQQLLSVSNTCSGQVLDFSNTSSRPLSPFRLVSRGAKAPKQC